MTTYIYMNIWNNHLKNIKPLFSLNFQPGQNMDAITSIVNLTQSHITQILYTEVEQRTLSSLQKVPQNLSLFEHPGMPVWSIWEINEKNINMESSLSSCWSSTDKCQSAYVILLVAEGLVPYKHQANLHPACSLCCDNNVTWITSSSINITQVQFIDA